MSKQTVECPKCSGRGVIGAFGHIANGVCFMCSGSKVVEVEKFAAKISADTRKKAEWLLASTEESYVGWTYARLNAARNFCHGGFGIQEAFPGLLAHWREVGDPAFFAAQEERLAEFYATR